MFVDGTMTEGVSALTTLKHHEASSLHSLLSNESRNFPDEIPSLDALSFQHELCPSRSCLCHHRKHLANNALGSSVFGGRNSPELVISQQQASATSCGERGEDQVLSSAQPVFQPMVPGCHSNANATSAARNCDSHVFGSGQDPGNYGSIESFASLGRISNPGVVETAAANGQPPPAFEQNHRGATQMPNNCEYYTQVIN